MLLPLPIIMQVYITQHIALLLYVYLVAELYSCDKEHIFIFEDAHSDFIDSFASIDELINHGCTVKTSFLEEWCL